MITFAPGTGSVCDRGGTLSCSDALAQAAWKSFLFPQLRWLTQRVTLCPEFPLSIAPQWPRSPVSHIDLPFLISDLCILSWTSCFSRWSARKIFRLRQGTQTGYWTWTASCLETVSGPPMSFSNYLALSPFIETVLGFCSSYRQAEGNSSFAESSSAKMLLRVL